MKSPVLAAAESASSWLEKCYFNATVSDWRLAKTILEALKEVVDERIEHCEKMILESNKCRCLYVKEYHKDGVNWTETDYCKNQRPCPDHTKKTP